MKSEKRGNVSFQQITTCPTCRGLGQFIDKPCPDCRGSGTVDREETLTVKVPVGVEEGMALRIPGRGGPAPVAGGTAGDLYVVVRTAPDPRFERRGPHLWRTELISAVDAVLGRKLPVATLDSHRPRGDAAWHRPAAARQGAPRFWR